MGQFIDFAYVKTHSDFPAVLAAYNIEHAGSGDELRCRCPFHDDKDPSMTVNVDKRVFNCHAAGCGEQGNILEFVSLMEDTNDLRTAATKLAEICNIDLSKPKARRFTKQRSENGKPRARNRADRPPTAKPKEPAHEPVDPGVNTPLTFRLNLDPEHEYGKSRSLSPSVIDRFEMGYCSRGSMSGRWCVPIHNADGNVVAYIGRYAAEPAPNDEPKYRLPKGFKKELELFNLHRVADHSQHVVLVEGVFDAIRLDTLEIPVVGLLGSSISDEQLALLKAHQFTHATVLLDAGTKKATRKLVHRVSSGLFVRSVELPDGTDPANVSADFLREQVPVFEL